MSALADLQQRFQDAILRADATPGLFAAESTGSGGFSVYLQAYPARLTAALRDNFPALQRALGDDAFAALAGAYIAEKPSHFRSIRWFGDSLVAFLAAAPERLPHPALVDLARMDWATRAAFDAADAILLSFDEVAALQPDEWPERVFKAVPSLQILDLEWAIEPIWKALNDDGQAATDAPQALPHVLLVWRPTLECCWRSADPCEAVALRALHGGAPFAECCTRIAEFAEGEPARTAAGLLQRWISEGLLARD
jgi:hypothetical protein